MDSPCESCNEERPKAPKNNAESLRQRWLRGLLAPIERSARRGTSPRAPRERRTGPPVWCFVNTSPPFISGKNLAGIKRSARALLRQPPARRPRGLRFIRTAERSASPTIILLTIGITSFPVNGAPRLPERKTVRKAREAAPEAASRRFPRDRSRRSESPGGRGRPAPARCAAAPPL